MTGILTETPGLHDKLTARQNLAYYGRLYGLRGSRPAGRGRPLPRRRRDEETRTAGSRPSARGCARRSRSRVPCSTSRRSSTSTSRRAASTRPPPRRCRDFVATLRALGRSIVVCTHNLDEAERLCDRIGVMRGTLLRVDTPAGLRRSHGRAARSPGRAERRRGPASAGAAGEPAVRHRRAGARGSTSLSRDPRHDKPDLVAALVTRGPG